MKATFIGLCLIGSVVASSSALAQRMNADDVKWINQCITDNKGGAADGVIRKYCMCMNEKMSDNETQSITQWEKSHPAERAACDKESGWK
jgi:phospholipid N-methyltransferase